MIVILYLDMETKTEKINPHSIKKLVVNVELIKNIPLDEGETDEATKWAK